jgi:hypothetical protein
MSISRNLPKDEIVDGLGVLDGGVHLGNGRKKIQGDGRPVALKALLGIPLRLAEQIRRRALFRRRAESTLY